MPILVLTYTAFTRSFLACFQWFSLLGFGSKCDGGGLEPALFWFLLSLDSLTLLDLPSVPGIPKFAGYGEITYSVIVLSYLLQSHIRAKYGIQVL